jgi:hypothetical protein
MVPMQAYFAVLIGAPMPPDGHALDGYAIIDLSPAA